MNRYSIAAPRLWDGIADDAREDMAVVVEDGLIAEIRPLDGLPADLERIEFPGCTVLPGLIDAHVHYSAAMGTAFLAAGVTTIRDVGNDLDWILERRALHEEDASLGPAIVCCGYLIDADPAIWPRMGRPHADEAAVRATVQLEVVRGVDAIKLYAGLDLERVAAGIDETHKLGKKTVAHLGAVTAEDAARAGLDCIEHLSGCGAAWKQSSEEELDTLADVLLQHAVAVDPTFVVWDRLGTHHDLAFKHDSRHQWVHPCHMAIWDQWQSNLGSRLHYQEAMAHLKRAMAHLHRRGVTVALGTDTPFPNLVPGFCLHDEMSMYIDAGLKPIDALRSGTSVNARVLGIADRTGSIQPGMQADFAIVDGDPLTHMHHIGNVVCTIRRGQRFTRTDLQARLATEAAVTPNDPLTLDLQGYLERFRQSAS